MKTKILIVEDEPHIPRVGLKGGFEKANRSRWLLLCNRGDEAT